MKKTIILLIAVFITLGIAMGCQTKPPTQTLSSPETPKIEETAHASPSPTLDEMFGTLTPIKPRPATSTPTWFTPQPSPTQTEVREKWEGKIYAIIKTEKGDIKAELFPDVAPNTVLNFVTLAKKGFYNGLTFHRVEPGDLIQGGDPNGNGTGGPGYSIPAEFNNRKHVMGTLAMARASDPNSAGSQFYICLRAIPELDNNYTIFGHVVEGISTAQNITRGDQIKTIEIEGDLPPYLQGKEIKKSSVR